jgi:hypothetical protein
VVQWAKCENYYFNFPQWRSNSSVDWRFVQNLNEVAECGARQSKKVTMKKESEIYGKRGVVSSRKTLLPTHHFYPRGDHL